MSENFAAYEQARYIPASSKTTNLLHLESNPIGLNFGLSEEWERNNGLNAEDSGD